MRSLNPFPGASDREQPNGLRLLAGATRLALTLVIVSASGCGGESAEEAAGPPPNPLLQPRSFNEQAPEQFMVRLETTKGPVVIQVHRSWAPLGADRFYNLAKAGFFDGMKIHRVLSGFTAEFGIHGDPWVNAAWRQAILADDPVVESNTRGRVSFSKSGPNSRTVQVFINTDDNPELDGRGFSPFGEVVEGLEAVDAFYAEYGDGPPRGEGVYQAMAIAKGDEYFDAEFPLLDTIEKASIVEDGGGAPS